MILPSLALTVFIIGYPIVDLAWTSVHEVSRFGQLRGFDGLVNYRELVEDPLFVASLWRTLIWTFCVVGGALLIGLPVALILNEDFIGRGHRPDHRDDALGGLADHDGGWSGAGRSTGGRGCSTPR